MTDTSSLQITTQIDDDTLVVTAVVLPGSFLPSDIFIFENTGTVELGRYQGVCAQSELLRLQVWQGQPIPVFGNRFVRFNQAKIVIDTRFNQGEASKKAIDNLIKMATALSNALQSSASSTQVVTIPT